MIRYCLETRPADTAVIHDVKCSAYDLGTLLGLGCVVDLGEFAGLGEAMAAIAHTHPAAVRCPTCCVPVQLLPLPRIRNASALIALVAMAD